MPLETIVYVSVLTGPARTPDGVTEFTAVLRRQMQVLDISGVFTTCDNQGVHVAQGVSASIDRLMVLVEAGFWQTETRVLERAPIKARDFQRWDRLDTRLFGPEMQWLREQLAHPCPPAEPIRALLTWAASRQMEREAGGFCETSGPSFQPTAPNRLH